MTAKQKQLADWFRNVNPTISPGWQQMNWVALTDEEVYEAAVKFLEGSGLELDLD